MKVIVPMAGTGNRFVQKGYEDPKPLIRINGKRIIEYIIDAFDKDKDEFIFVCNEDHLKTTKMEEILSSLVSNFKIVAVPNHKFGPVFTVSKVFDLIEDEDEVMVSYCDNPFVWDLEKFKKFLNEKSPDGCVISHSGFHPHALNSTKMAFMKTDGQKVLAIKEKECYTDNHFEEHASTGAYYFKKGSYIKTFFKEALEKNLTYNGEFYVTLVYNLLIDKGLNVMYYDTPFVTVFGTPEEVESFNAWLTVLRSGQVKNKEDLLRCYDYWKNYHGESI